MESPDELGSTANVKVPSQCGDTTDVAVLMQVDSWKGQLR